MHKQAWLWPQKAPGICGKEPQKLANKILFNSIKTYNLLNYFSLFSDISICVWTHLTNFSPSYHVGEAMESEQLFFYLQELMLQGHTS